MPNCSSISGTRWAKNSSGDGNDEDAPELAQHAGVAGVDLRRRAVGLAVGLSITHPLPVARAGPARPVLYLEAVGDFRAVPDFELLEVQAWRLQRLVQRRLCQVHGAHR